MTSSKNSFVSGLTKKPLFVIFVVVVSIVATLMVTMLILLSSLPKLSRAFVRLPQSESDALQFARSIENFEIPKGYRVSNAWKSGFFTNVDIVPKGRIRNFRISMLGSWSPFGEPSEMYLSPEDAAASFAAAFEKKHPQCHMHLAKIETISIRDMPVHLAMMQCGDRSHEYEAEIGEIPAISGHVRIVAIGKVKDGFDNEALEQLLHSIR